MGDVIPEQLGLDCMRKVAEHESGSKPIGGVPPWLLL